MRTRFAAGDGPEGAPFEVPDERLVGVAEPRAGAPADVDALVARALAAPASAPPLRERARGARRVLLLVDDATRHTPTARILPHVARELAAAGVPDSAVTVLTAQGTHRRMTEEELDRKVGPALRARWRVEQHDWLDLRRLRSHGATRGGLPVVANALLAESDLVAGVGQVGVHGILGFSGGAKIVLPGVAGHDAEAWTHWRGSLLGAARLMGVPENPLRLEVEEGARMAGLHAVLNVALDRDGVPQRAAYGDPVRAQRECARTARDLAAARLAEAADVVVVDAAPADRDFWQSVKGLYAADVAMRDGALVVLVAANPEGVARNHPDFLSLAGLPSEEVRRRVEAGEARDQVGAAIAHWTARIRERSGGVLLVSRGVTPDEARALGFEPLPDAGRAVEEALRRAGPGARVAVLRRAGALLPVVPGRNERHLQEAWQERLA